MGMFDKYCHIQCTQEEMASLFGVSVDTLERRIEEYTGMGFAEYYRQKKSGGKASLRRSQWLKAIDDKNPTMLIWLGKQFLNQSDKTEIEQNVTGGFAFVSEEDAPEGKV